MGIVFDIITLGDDLGKYVPIDDNVTIYLGTIYHQFKLAYGVTENKLIYEVIDTINHEELHRALDSCLDDPNDGDDHTIFKHLIH